MTRLDGPRLLPASGDPPRSLVVLLHGYGADGGDLVPLAEAWRPAFPETAFLSPHAPEPCDGYPVGRQWFELALGDRALIAKRARPASVPLVSFLEVELSKFGLSHDALALVGFSQGGMMALEVGLALRPTIAGVVSFSGVLPRPPTAEPPYPPVLLGHGTADPVVPFAALADAEATLKRAGIAVEAMARPGLQHGIDMEEMAAAARFLQRCLSA